MTVADPTGKPFIGNSLAKPKTLTNTIVAAVKRLTNLALRGLLGLGIAMAQEAALCRFIGITMNIAPPIDAERMRTRVTNIIG